MAEWTCTLGFGVTYGTVAMRTACGQLVSLSHHGGDEQVPPHKRCS